MELKKRLAIFSDIHANLEALKAILLDIKKEQIETVISLGDIVGTGPKPRECLNLIINENIVNILGNSDCYNLYPLNTYRHFRRDPKGENTKNALWTLSQLSKEQLDYLQKMPPSIDLKIGDKTLALCHFPCDTRYFPQATWLYNGQNPDIFYTTNTIKDHRHFLPRDNVGALEAKKRPIFDGKTIDSYDDVIFGHYHFERFSAPNEKRHTAFHSLNAGGVAIYDKAIYYIIEPSTNGYNINRKSVPYDREKLLYDVDRCDFPNKKKFKFYINSH